MQVILLERIEKLGQMGDVVNVKPGYARNYLLPQKKALRATEDNVAFFEDQRAQLEADNLERRQEAESVGGKMDGAAIIVIRAAGDSGQLYGSVNSRDIAAGLTEAGFTVSRSQVQIARPIKEIGMHDVRIVLHPEVDVEVMVNVARSGEEAETQAERHARGEDPVVSQEEIQAEIEAEAEEAADEAAPDVAELLEDDQVEAFEARQAEDAEAEAEATAEEASPAAEPASEEEAPAEPEADAAGEEEDKKEG